MMSANSRPEPVEGEAARTLTDHLRDVALIAQEMARSERIARVRAVRGKYAHVPTSSDAFVQSKREEIAREDRRS